MIILKCRWRESGSSLTVKLWKKTCWVACQTCFVRKIGFLCTKLEATKELATPGFAENIKWTVSSEIKDIGKDYNTLSSNTLLFFAFLWKVCKFCLAFNKGVSQSNITYTHRLYFAQHYFETFPRLSADARTGMVLQGLPKKQSSYIMKTQLEKPYSILAFQMFYCFKDGCFLCMCQCLWSTFLYDLFSPQYLNCLYLCV